jgi:hypothetical protein
MSTTLPAGESAGSDSVATQTAEPQAVLAYADPPSASSIAVIGVRLLALFFLGAGLVDASQLIAQVVVLLFEPARGSIGSWLIPCFYILPAMVWLGLSRYCWVKAPSMAPSIIPSTAKISFAESSLPDQLLAVVLIGVGVYMIGEGASELSRFICSNFQGIRYARADTFLDGNFVSPVVRLFFGVWLVFGTRGIISILQKHSARRRDE